MSGPKLLLKVMIIIADDDATGLCTDDLTNCVIRVLGIYLQVIRSTETSTHICPLLINTQLEYTPCLCAVLQTFFTVFLSLTSVYINLKT